MIRRIDGCVGCGLLPCHHCTELEIICDECECEVENLYKWDDEQLCEDCYKARAFEDAEEVDYEPTEDDD